MLRDVLAAIAGYVAMVVVVMLGLGLVWLAVGASGAFDAEGPYPSTIWIVGNFLFGFLAAVVGGWVARRLGRSRSSVTILVALLLVLGAYFAITAEQSYGNREPVEKPVAEMTFREAGQHARSPTWYLFTMPLIGVAGALVGGRYRAADRGA